MKLPISTDVRRNGYGDISIFTDNRKIFVKLLIRFKKKLVRSFDANTLRRKK